MSDFITIKIDYSDPIELVSFTQSLQTMGRRWTRTLKSGDSPRVDEEMKLYVRNIREGSIIVDLTTLANQALVAGVVSVAANPQAAIDGANGVADFLGKLKKTIDYFAKRGPRPVDLTTKDCTDARDIVAPITNQSKGGMIISTGDNSPVSLTINVNTLEANAIQNRAGVELELLKQPQEQSLVSTPFFWQQADIGPARADGASPDKGVVEAIDPQKALKVFFVDDTLKRKMIEGEENPFAFWWLIDVDVIVVSGKNSAYRITAVHGKADLQP